jgi:hypothetical protein
MDQPVSLACYQIRVRGHLGDTLLAAFPGLDAEASAGQTVLTGVPVDQAALHGVLAQIQMHGLELLEVRCIAAPTRPAV